MLSFSPVRGLDPLDGWSPSPFILGQTDPLGPSIMGCMDSLLDGWMPLVPSLLGTVGNTLNLASVISVLILTRRPFFMDCKDNTASPTP